MKKIDKVPPKKRVISIRIGCYDRLLETLGRVQREVMIRPEAFPAYQDRRLTLSDVIEILIASQEQ